MIEKLIPVSEVQDVELILRGAIARVRGDLERLPKESLQARALLEGALLGYEGALQQLMLLLEGRRSTL